MSPGWQTGWLGLCPLKLGKGSSELHTISQAAWTLILEKPGQSSVLSIPPSPPPPITFPVIPPPWPLSKALTVLCWVGPSRLKWRSTYCDERR